MAVRDRFKISPDARGDYCGPRCQYGETPGWFGDRHFKIRYLSARGPRTFSELRMLLCPSGAPGVAKALDGAPEELKQVRLIVRRPS